MQGGIPILLSSLKSTYSDVVLVNLVNTILQCVKNSSKRRNGFKQAKTADVLMDLTKFDSKPVKEAVTKLLPFFTK